MRSPRVRAVVLAAGLGTRLRPLTEFVPKALLPVAGKPLVARTLARLAAAGCEAAALNLHHLGEKIRRRLGGALGGMPLTYSPERELLGTLGALAPLRKFLEPADLVLVVNGDSLCRWPIERLIRRHRRTSARVTMLFSTRAEPAEFGGGVGLDLEGQVVSFGPDHAFGEVDRRRVFAGAQVIAPDLVARLEERPADIIDDLYSPFLEAGGRIHGMETARPWFDLGTPRRYLRAALRTARGRWPLSQLKRSWIGPGAVVDSGAKVREVVVESGARIEAGAEVERSLLLSGSRITAGCRVRGSVLGFEVVLPPETLIDRRLVTPERANVTAREQDSVVGGLVYSPM